MLSQFYEDERIPVCSNDLHIHQCETFNSNNYNEEKITQIGQTLFKHEYMRRNYSILMFTPEALSKLYKELIYLMDFFPFSPSKVFLTSTGYEKANSDRLFKGSWGEVKQVLDFIGKSNNKKPVPFDPDEDDVYIQMYS